MTHSMRRLKMTSFSINTLDDNDAYYDALLQLYKGQADRNNNNVGKKIYLAGPWFDPAALELCKFVEAVIAYESEDLHTTFFPRQGGNTVNISPKAVFDLNVKHVNECDVVIAMISRKDVGTAWEIGMAHALGKEVVLLGYDESDFTGSKTNLMLAFCGKAMTLAKLTKYLRGNMTDKDWFKFDDNNWEVIE